MLGLIHKKTKDASTFLIDKTTYVIFATMTGKWFLIGLMTVNLKSIILYLFQKVVLP